MKWYTSVKVKSHIEIFHSPPRINVHTCIFYPNVARYLNKEVTWTYTLKNKETSK